MRKVFVFVVALALPFCLRADLPTGPPISIGDIVAEFGGSGALTAYYRGGANVPDISVNAGVPTSGTITIRDFFGAGDFNYSLTVGTSGGAAGFTLGPPTAFGSLSPGSVGGFSVQTFIGAGNPSFDFTLGIVCGGGCTKTSLFSSIELTDGAGTVRTYTAASATYSTPGATHFWQWGTGSNQIYSPADSGEVKPIRFNAP